MSDSGEQKARAALPMRKTLDLMAALKASLKRQPALAVLFIRILAEHDTAQPRKENGCHVLLCLCGMRLSSPDEDAVYELHRAHIANALARGGGEREP